MSNIDLTRMITAADKQRRAEQQTQAERIAEARAFLDATDWYVTRQTETGRAIPEDIRKDRSIARDLVTGGGDGLDHSDKTGVAP